VPILFTGLRPGEKLDEELMSNFEATIPTVVDKIRLVNTDEVDNEALRFGLDRIDTLLAAGTEQEVRDAIRSLVPEYTEFPRGGDVNADGDLDVPRFQGPRIVVQVRFDTQQE
jgi:FlaA1/EpsC-like NDP-sugar epimerase